MEQGLKRFVGRILAVHLLLLAVLLAVVWSASRHIYHSARSQALRQAEERQNLLANQTAQGVEGFYQSILGDLNLLKPVDEETADLPDALNPFSLTPTPDSRPLQGFAILNRGATEFLSHQLQGRAHLFVLDERLHPHALVVDDDSARPLPTTKPRVARIQRNALNNPSTPFEDAIVAKLGGWLKEVREPTISPFQVIEEQGGGGHAIKLVCVPLTTGPRPNGLPQRSAILVAAVAARPIEQHFLAGLAQHGVTGALLVDDSMTIIAASNHGLLDNRIDASAEPQLQEALASFERLHYDGTRPLDKPFHIGPQSFDPSIVSVHPVEVLGKKWFVLVASPLSGVDGVVRDLSEKAVFWAAFVAFSMTAILVSTAAQLIRSRMRMERERHAVLRQEVREARKIQLAWLPEKTKTIAGAAIDIASLNRPANHISGDFYNFFELPDGRTAVAIGDVTGHGIAAAFLMATTQLLVRVTLPGLCDPGRCLEEVNRQLCSQAFNGQFVTMQLLIIDARTGEVEIATAGHPAPLISGGGGFTSLKIEPQLVLGVDASAPYPTERFLLGAGSTVLLYTDGVVEAEDRAGDRLRVDGLRLALESGGENAESVLQKAISAVNTFRRGRELRDDLTLVAVRLQATPDAPPTPRPEAALASAARG
ncbi:MAG: sodium/solute symporter, and family protein serine/threonine phosphatase domain protein [Phycisphaerales bacterium]|nr:sodium/solute symporter, and family protein serine/threonine phosphatase domain protein [Phycisphaerales bacterium]